MTIWLVEPRDPLIVRDGRPFSPDSGAWAASLPFPFPSTIAGGVRRRSALDEDGAFKYEQDDKEQLKQLKGIRIRGPLLVQLADEGDALAPDENAWLVPMPDDVQLFATDAEGVVRLLRFVPLTLPAGAQTDFAQQSREQQLLLVGQSRAAALPRKPLAHALRYWYWQPFQTWLIDPAQLEQEDDLPLSSLGREDLLHERRLHVSMDSEREMGKEGLLFGTSGLEFTHPGAQKQRLHKARRLALAVDVDETNVTFRGGVASFGGERRIVTWRQSNAHLPPCPKEIKQAIKRDGHCRLVLLTPAHFAEGYYPSWLRTTHAQQCGVDVELRAIAVRRPQVVSGWDLALGRPKSSRRLAAAGTVLFLSVKAASDAALEIWIERTWMHCMSDDEQSRCDGFGLAVLGTWSGQPVAMQ